MNAGLILAGGKGERIIGHDIPKQFIEIGGKPIISYCIQEFNSCPDINIICVVTDEKWHNLVGEYIFANPGISRQHSIYNGLKALKAYAPKYVVIHDSARPCVTQENISEYIRYSQEYDGATPTLPVNETIYYSFNGKTLSSTLNRDKIFMGQTPECYDFTKYLGAHEQYSEMLDEFRGSSTIAVNTGMKIACVKGNPNNFKITTNADLERFRVMVEER